MLRILLRVFRESSVLVAAELRSNMLRSLLSLSGISIGIFCIIAVLSSVESLQRNLEKGLEKLGSNVIYIDRFPWAEPGGEYQWWKYLLRPNPTYQELQLVDQKTNLADATAMASWQAGRSIKYGRTKLENITASIVTYQYDRIYDFEFDKGRWFSAAEAQAGRNGIVLGYEVAKALFPNKVDPVGKEVWVMGRKFRVIGVLSKEGESLIDTSHDNSVIFLFEHFRRFGKLDDSDVVILVQGREQVTNAELKDELIPILRSKRRLKPLEENNFALNESTVATNALKQSFAMINVVGFVIGFFALLVGGFGIANIMFVSVRERTPAIGIKKALGAKKYFILLEFLIEAVGLCLAGCALGLLLVWALISALNASPEIGFEFVMSFRNIMLGIIVAFSTGLIFGLVPALSAARLDPVEAIRA
jgi:putative ABC transport system permease protein